MAMKKKSLLVTGGLGFVGSRIVKKLYKDYDIVVLDWDTTSSSAVAQAEEFRQDSITVHLMNIADCESWKKLGGFDFIFHGAAQTAAEKSWGEGSVQDYLSNAYGTMLLAQHALDYSEKVIYCNSIRIYDYEAVNEQMDRNGVVSEDCKKVIEATKLHPPFCISKYWGELYLRWYAQKDKTGKMQVISNRMSGIVGPGQSGSKIHGWISFLIECAEEGKEYTVYGDGEQSRDILHISDYVDLIKLQLWKFEHFSEKKFAAYNIGGGQKNRISNNEVIDFLNVNSAEGTPRTGEPLHYVSDIKRIEQKGWAPKKTDAYEIITDLVARYREEAKK